MSATEKPNPPLSVSAVARELNMSEHSVRQLIKSGQLAGFKIGPHFRIRREALAALIRASEAA